MYNKYTDFFQLSLSLTLPHLKMHHKFIVFIGLKQNVVSSTLLSVYFSVAYH